MIEPEMAFLRLKPRHGTHEEFIKLHHRPGAGAHRPGYGVFRQVGRIRDGFQVLERCQSSRLSNASPTPKPSRRSSGKESFEFPVRWDSISSRNTKNISPKKVFGVPVILTDFPKEIKPFT